MNTSVLFRKTIAELGEFESCCKYNTTHEYRTDIPENSNVIGRYSVLPYYEELEKELNKRNSKLINNYQQHRYIADLTHYYRDLKQFTPKSWDNWADLPSDTSFIIKGKTNSRKFNWKDLMFCQDAKDVAVKANRLLDDTFILEQGIVVREYVPLRRFDTGVNGLPITNEWRFFCYKEEVVDYGYYWFEEYEPEKVDEGAIELVNKIMPIVSKKSNFYVIDVAETEKGDWIMIELNDGQMSGLSLIPIDRFYKNLSEKLK
jgi:hypothetical protein